MANENEYKDRIRRAIAKGQERQLKKLGFGTRKRINDKPEKEVEKDCLDWMRSIGWSVEIYEAKATRDSNGIWRNQAMKAGTVDCMGSTDEGISAIVEFKAPGKRVSGLRPGQHDFISEKIASNCFACVVDSAAYLEWAYSNWKNKRASSHQEAKDFLLSILPQKRVYQDKEFDL